MLVCPVLSFFGGSKCDADMESVLHMCLDVLALQHLENQSQLAGTESPDICLKHCGTLLRWWDIFALSRDMHGPCKQYVLSTHYLRDCSLWQGV